MDTLILEEELCQVQCEEVVSIAGGEMLACVPDEWSWHGRM